MNFPLFSLYTLRISCIKQKLFAMLRETRNKEKYNEIVLAAVDIVKNTGFTHIQADLPEYEQPTRLINKADDFAFVPDIVAEKGGQKGYFEISKKTEDLKKLIGKWKLLSLMAKLRNGIFRIFVPRGHMKFTRDLLKQYDIDADLVKL